VARINNSAPSPQEPFHGGTSGFRHAFTGEDWRSPKNIFTEDPSSRHSRIVGLCKLLSGLALCRGISALPPNSRKSVSSVSRVIKQRRFWLLAEWISRTNYKNNLSRLQRYTLLRTHSQHRRIKSAFTRVSSIFFPQTHKTFKHGSSL
jgi:hypothetical protein